VILIAGGDGKGADFAPLAEPVARQCRALIVIGRDVDVIAAAVGKSVPTLKADSLSAAVNQAAGQAQPGDRVLLSPACASFDMFDSYSDRGDQFRALVEAL
jgi:UDP-N-acetylmuramoylalanine--D-glutamate ligase